MLLLSLAVSSVLSRPFDWDTCWVQGLGLVLMSWTALSGPKVSAFGLSLNICRFGNYGSDLDYRLAVPAQSFIQFLCWMDCKTVSLKKTIS